MLAAQLLFQLSVLSLISPSMFPLLTSHLKGGQLTHMSTKMFYHMTVTMVTRKQTWMWFSVNMIKLGPVFQNVHKQVVIY